MDRIEKLRADIALHMDRDLREPGSDEESFSPSGRYRLTFKVFGTRDPSLNWSVAEVRIFDVETSALLHSFIRGDDRFFHAWVTKDGIEYLLLPEHLEGQSIYCPSTGCFESVAPEEDEFIGCTFHPSLTGRYLAVVGCIWGCPFTVNVYDFSDPMSLPLPKVLDGLGTHDMDFDIWLSDTSFRLKAPLGGEMVHTLT